MLTFDVKIFETTEQFEEYLNKKQVNLDKIKVCMNNRQIVVVIQNGKLLSEENTVPENKVDTLGTVRENNLAEFFGDEGTFELNFFDKYGVEISPNELCKIDMNTPVLGKRKVCRGVWQIVLDIEWHEEVAGAISKTRLEELCMLFKDGLIADGEDMAYTYFKDICELSDSEAEWLGLENWQSEDKGFDDSAAWEDGSNRGCIDCLPEDCNGHCMSCDCRPF